MPTIDVQLQIEDNSILTSFLKETPDIKSKMIYLGYTLYQDCKQMISGSMDFNHSSKPFLNAARMPLILYVTIFIYRSLVLAAPIT